MDRKICRRLDGGEHGGNGIPHPDVVDFKAGADGCCLMEGLDWMLTSLYCIGVLMSCCERKNSPFWATVTFFTFFLEYS
jgi:hypothetical protein